MEAGPIDAITNDAKYTLSEEKLLKKYNQQAKQGSDEPAFEAKCLVSCPNLSNTLHTFVVHVFS